MGKTHIKGKLKLKIKGFRKKNEHEVKQTKNKTEKRERKRERETLYILFVVCVRHSLMETCSEYGVFHYCYTDSQYHVGFVD